MHPADLRPQLTQSSGIAKKNGAPQSLSRALRTTSCVVLRLKDQTSRNAQMILHFAPNTSGEARMGRGQRPHSDPLKTQQTQMGSVGSVRGNMVNLLTPPFLTKGLPHDIL